MQATAERPNPIDPSVLAGVQLNSPTKRPLNDTISSVTLKAWAAQPAATDEEAGAVADLVLRFTDAEKSLIRGASGDLAAASRAQAEAEASLSAAQRQANRISYLRGELQRAAADSYLAGGAVSAAAKAMKAELEQCQQADAALPELDRRKDRAVYAAGSARVELQRAIASARAGLADRCTAEYERFAFGILKSLSMLQALAQAPARGDQDWTHVHNLAMRLAIPALRVRGCSVPVVELHGVPHLVGRDSPIGATHLTAAIGWLAADTRSALMGD